MYKGKRILGIIPARGGSKGIPRKNVTPLAGRPLIAYTLEAACGSRHLTRCIVSTDSDDIATVAREYGGDVPFMRPSELAGDDSTSIAVVQHALRWLRDHGEEYDYVMILQPTSPLRTAQDIDACIEKIVDTGADSVMSMVQLSDMAPQKLKRIEEDAIAPLLQEEGKASQQRDASGPVYKRNTAVYLTRTSLIEQGDLFGAVSRPYLMPRERSIDINEPVDLEMAEFFLKRKG